MENFEEQLSTISEKIEIDLIKIGEFIAKEYRAFYSAKVIDNMNFSFMDTRKTTRLNPVLLGNLKEEERKFVIIDDRYTINVADKIDVVVNSKGYVLKLIDKGNIEVFSTLKTLEEVLYQLHNKKVIINYHNIDKYYEEIYIKSLLFNYAYSIIASSIISETDSIRAGMFKNAYFDILQAYKKINVALKR